MTATGLLQNNYKPTTESLLNHFRITTEPLQNYSPTTELSVNHYRTATEPLQVRFKRLNDSEKNSYVTHFITTMPYLLPYYLMLQLLDDFGFVRHVARDLVQLLLYYLKVPLELNTILVPAFNR